MKLTFGADFETFVQVNGQIVPICGLLGGTKEEPIQFEGLPEGFKYQEDGVTAEFNIPPCETPKAWEDAMLSALSVGGDLVKKKLGKKARLVLKSAHTFDLEKLTPHPQALTIGCNPDFQAYFDGRERDVPDIVQMGGMRFAGTHIHLGYDTFRLPEWMMALVMDQYLYRCADDYCYDRALYYPKGIFRPKPYGVEYRALGSSQLNYISMLRNSLDSLQSQLTSHFSETVDGCLAHKDREADILMGGDGRIAGAVRAAPRMRRWELPVDL